MPEVLGLSRSLLRLAIGGYHEGITMAGLRRLASLKLEVQVTFGAPAIPVACRLVSMRDPIAGGAAG